jgi:thymidine kinase
MKSGKSYDLISYFAPLKYTTIPHVLYQSQRNVRDEQVTSRNGVALAAQKISDTSVRHNDENLTFVAGITDAHSTHALHTDIGYVISLELIFWQQNSVQMYEVGCRIDSC